MKNRIRRITAMFLAVSLMAASGSVGYKSAYVYAEEGTEAVVASAEEAPAPETQAPTEAPQPQTQAPTEAPQPETTPPTEAPAPETQPPTEAPAPETQAQTAQSETQPQETAQQPAESEKKETELAKESEEVKLTRTVTGRKGSGVFTITLPKDKKVPETAALTIEVTKRKDDSKNLSKVEGLLNHGAQEFSGGRFYTLHLYDGEKELNIPKGTRVEYSNDEGRTIGIAPCRQSEVHILDISGDSASEISAEIALSSDGMAVKTVSFETSKGFCAFAIAGSKNRENAGMRILQKDLYNDLKKTAPYTILAETYTGDAKEGVRTADTQKEDAAGGSENEKSVDEQLTDLSGCTLKLGDALSSSDLVIVNLYTDENGTFRTDYDNPQNPLKEVMTQDGRIDVAGRMVVVNLIASDPNTGTLELPKIGIAVTKDGKLQSVSDIENSEMAGRVIFNIAAVGTGTEGAFKLAPYGGKIVVKEAAVGNYFAPNAEITFEKELTGGVYAKSVTTKKKVVSAAVFAERVKEEKEAAAKAEAAKETEAAAQTEAAEIETETETEAEAATETESEEEQLLEAAADDAKGLAGGAEAGTVTVVKTDGSTPVPNAELALYNTVALTTEDEKTIEADTELYTWTSGSDPEDISAWILPGGKYVIRETLTPSGHAKAMDVEYTPTTEPKDEGGAQTTVVKEETITVTDTKVTPETPEMFPRVAVKDSVSTEFLEGVSLTISKHSVTSVKDADQKETQSKTDPVKVGSFNSEKKYVTIDLASILSSLTESEIAPSTALEDGSTTETYVVLTIEETSRYPGHRFDGAYATTIDVHKNAEGSLTIDYSQCEQDGIGEKQDNIENLTFKQKEVTFTVVSYKKDTTEIVPGTAFKFLGTGGAELVPGKDYTVADATVSESTVTITNNKATIKLINEDEIEALSSDSSKSLTVSWVTIPGEYLESSSTPALNFTSRDSVLYLEMKKVIGTVTISSKVRVLSDEKTTNPTNTAETYTFSLYKEGSSDPIPNKTLTVSTYNYKTSSTVSFDNLDPGVYYLKEEGAAPAEKNLSKIKYAHTFLDLDGKWKKASGTQSGNGIKITIQADTSSSQSATVVDAHKVDFTNIYSQPDTLKGSFKIKVRVVDENNQETPATLTAGFTVKWTSGGKNWAVNPKPSLSLKNVASLTSKKYTIPFPSEEQSVAVKVKMVSLTDENGNNVAGKYTLVHDTEYTKLNSYQKTINITNGLTDGLVTFTLKKVPTKQSVAQLTLTKRVTYQNVPMRVNATYYLGIFTDAAHKNLLFKKALSLSNASSRTSTLKINLYKLKNSSHSITLYFAETDSKGNVVSGGKKTGYNISLNMDSVTLSPTKAEATVVLTNDIIRGSKAARRLTDPSSGFAGDRSALAEAQELANSDSKTSRKTGDETPIARNVAIALGSGSLALLLAAVLVFRRRRRRRR